MSGILDDGKKLQKQISQEKAALQKTLLAAAAAKPKSDGKIVNAYGQEEVGVPKWQQKQAALREMYASNSSAADVGHEQRIMMQLEAKRRARSQNPEEARMAASAAAHRAQLEDDEQRSLKRSRDDDSSSDSDSSRERKKKKDKKKKKEKKSKKDKKKKKHKDKGRD